MAETPILQVMKLRLREVRSELGVLNAKSQFLFIVPGCQEESDGLWFRSCDILLPTVFVFITSLCPGQLVGSGVAGPASAPSLLYLGLTAHFPFLG